MMGKMEMIKWVWCTFQFEAFHSWAEAPEGVTFLKNKHRHLFKCKVWVEVEHNDRDIEFILLKRDCERLVNKLTKNNVGSCEMLAELFLKQLSQKYKGRGMMAEVSEDGENGALIEMLEADL